MNPSCRIDLFRKSGDVIEKAHIVPYCKDKDNSYENLIILCPNCHTDFDKNGIYSEEDVMEWKRKRKNEIELFFSVKYASFKELEDKIRPILMQNREIYEQYYLGNNKDLWDKFEDVILVNNRKMKDMLSSNINLFHYSKDYDSNQDLVNEFILHINEFEATRESSTKVRKVLFPECINSIFGVSRIESSLTQSTESLECFLKEMIKESRLVNINLGLDDPYISIRENDSISKVYLNDAPRIRQLFSVHNSFRKTVVRLESLNFIIKYLNNNGISFEYSHLGNLREIIIGGKKVIFVYFYCLNEVTLRNLSPESKSVIVNLHNWNNDLSISEDAYKLAEVMEVTLLTLDKFYSFSRKL